MKRIIPFLALLLCAALFATGCGGGATSAKQTAMGRYVEEAIELPFVMGEVAGIKQFEDDSIWLLGRMIEGRTDHGIFGGVQLWHTEDNGTTWTRETPPWLDAATRDQLSIESAAFVSPEELYIIIQPDQEGEDGGPNYVMHHVKGGVLKSCGYSVAGTIEGANAYPYGVDYADGSLLIHYDFNTNRIDAESGRVLNSYPVDDLVKDGSGLVLNDRLAIVQKTKIDLYQFSDSQIVGEIPVTKVSSFEDDRFSNSPTDLTALAAGVDSSALYYANSTGLYRAFTDGAATEKLMDGSLSSLGLPTMYLQYLFANQDGSFLAIAFDSQLEQAKLLRYTYDPEMPTIPGSELVVYSLRDNQTIRQTLGEFQLQNPDIKTTYRIGMTGEDGVTIADALRNLSTELLSGKGPDILVLDGIPINSYIEKRILADLSGLLDEKINTGVLFPNIANAYRSEQGLFAIPARYAVPLVHGVDIEPVKDVSSLAKWLEGREVKNLGIPVENMMERFYPIASPNWFREDGSLDDAAFTADLTCLEQFSVPTRDPDAYAGNPDGQLLFSAIGQTAGKEALGLGLINNITDIGGPYSQIAEAGKGEVHLFPEKGVLLPRTVLGINASSSQKEQTEKLIELALSTKLQTLSFEDGIPVNNEALQANIDASYNTELGMVGTCVDDPVTGEVIDYYLRVKMASRADTERTVAEIKGINSVVHENGVVKRIMIDETLDYLWGRKGLEDTVQSVKAKLDLYLAE